MITLTTTIQEISLQAYAFGVFDYLFNDRNMSRDEILNIFEKWGEEFEDICRAHTDEDDWFYYDEVDEFINKKYMELKLADVFPFGIAVGDHISYEGGIYLITGITDRGIAVDEVRPGKDPGWIVTEIGFSQHDKIKILPDHEEIIAEWGDAHDPELRKKINDAWNKNREGFAPILRTLYARDIEEITDHDAFQYTDWLDTEVQYKAVATGDWRPYMDMVLAEMQREWDFYADNYLNHIADDTDLECILAYLHYPYLPIYGFDDYKV